MAIEKTAYSTKCFVSKDYSKLNYFSENRFANAGNQVSVITSQMKDFLKRVKRMKAVIVENGYNKCFPIICFLDEGNTLRMVDGQTRFEVCKELGIEFYYEIRPFESKEDALKCMFSMNNTGTAWTVTEKLLSIVSNVRYPESDRKNAKFLVDMSTIYCLPMSEVMTVACGEGATKKQNFEKCITFVNNNSEDIFKLAYHIAGKCSLGLRVLSNRSFLRSVARVYRMGEFNAIIKGKLESTSFIFEKNIKEDNVYLELFHEAVNSGRHTGKNIMPILPQYRF